MIEKRLRRIAIVLLTGVAAVAATPPHAHAGDPLDVEITRTGDGSYAAKLKTALPAGWEAGVGMDIALPQADDRTLEPGIAARWDQTAQPTGEPSTTAWSTVSMPAPSWLMGGKATLRAQVNPISSTAGLGGSVAQSRPLGEHLAASLITDFTVTETGIGTAENDQSWEANRSVRLDIKPTGTALIARGQLLGTDGSVHTFLTAEQSLGGGVDLTTSLSDIEDGEPVLNVGARLNRRW